ncbi:MAG TPA: COX15/CtaA family protein [Candidatus Baltobacteraceae bacterium]|nr:COX15/CtaA family protein [Candidatus Baltobacteraceae bacterium]
MVQNNWLKRYAVFAAAATFVLVWMGGLVTSHEAGLTVPDWPNSYGYNMFFFPVSKWIGGIFYEHTHRLVASGVGFLTTVLAFWLFGRNSRPLLRWIGVVFAVAGLGLCLKFPTHASENLLLAGIGLAGFAASFYWPNCEPSPKWLRVLGVAAFVAVVAQGILGGLRVTELKDQLGIFHATLAQIFLLLMCAIALFLSDFWRELPVHGQADSHRFRPLFVFTTALILCQLMLGATMRHQHAGLAIPDFPAAYGKIWPATDAGSILRYNSNRIEVIGYNPITAFQVELQMAHRLLALVLFAAIGFCAWRARRCLGVAHWLTRLSFVWFGLVLTQALLGAATIWTGKSADIATAHVACGALCLVTGGLASIIACRLLGVPARNVQAAVKNELATLLPSSSITAR